MKHWRRVLAWLLLAGVFPTREAVANAATIGTSSYLQVNLSYMPFNDYDTAHSAASSGFTNGLGVSACPAGASVQGCFKTILGQLRAQGVQGVRIFVQLCGSSSTAFPNCGSPYTAVSWNPSQIFVPANLDHQCRQLLPGRCKRRDTERHDHAGKLGAFYGVPASQTSTPQGEQGALCPDAQSTVYFSPTDPFGYNQSIDSNGNISYFPIGDFYNTANNEGYNCSPINSQYFIGWTNYFNVINAMLAAARGRVNIYEFELQQELNAQPFTALMRWIYDNSLPASAPSQYLVSGNVDVLAALRALMSANGFFRAAWRTRAPGQRLPAQRKIVETSMEIMRAQAKLIPLRK